MKNMKIFLYLSKVKKLLSEFEDISIEQLPRSKNLNADALTNLWSPLGLEYRRTIPIEIFAHLSIMDMEVVCNIKKIDKTWIDLIMFNIQNKNLLRDKLKAQSCRALL